MIKNTSHHKFKLPAFSLLISSMPFVLDINKCYQEGDFSNIY